MKLPMIEIFLLCVSRKTLNSPVPRAGAGCKLQLTNAQVPANGRE